MKTLYESILSSTKSGKLALIKKLSWIIPKMIAKNIVWTLLGRK